MKISKIIYNVWMMEHIPQGCHGNQITPPLPSNKQLTIGRLRSTTQKLERMQRLKEYHMVMTEQLAEGILEEVPETPTGEVIRYIPHQPVIRD